ncbi:MAG: general secretion pathway protein GspK [Candidatus Omnitrophica bacterium]|nr:general secretion pathway protein GspK [Candidatus Omnitrophota bacterium]
MKFDHMIQGSGFRVQGTGDRGQGLVSFLTPVPYPLNPEKGSVLIAVLWSLFFLAALALVINVLITPQLALAAKLRDRIMLRYLAKAGIARVIIEIRADETEDYDALNEPWNDNEGAFKEISLTDDGYCSIEYLLPSEEGEKSEARYGLIDEERKINVNKAPADVLARLIELAAELPARDARDIVGAVVDWRDKDDDPSENGAESSYYESLEGGYPCKNAPFEVLEELRLIKGITQEIFDKIKDRVTVYGRGFVNINTADALVLEILGFSSGLAEKIIYFRSGNDGQAATEDDNAFENAGSIAATLASKIGLSQAESEEFEAVMEQGIVGVSSDNFRGYSFGRFRDGDAFSKIAFVINRDEQIRYWRED